ncbi:Uncharacterised protein [Turicibacter sanguinis]|nr:Uncharacterised protein [Turicibacter sanguinis]
MSEELKNVTEVNELFKREDLLIYYDEEFKVRVKAKKQCQDKIIKAHEIVMQINDLPMSKKMRKNYGKEISNIYQIAYFKSEVDAENFGNKLLIAIENNIVIYKKIEFIIPSVILTLISVIGANICGISSYTYVSAFIYGPIGGLLAIIIKQQELDIDYKVQRYVLIIESLKKVIISIIVAIIGIISIKSQFIFYSFNFEENIYMEYLVLILCGYSQTFIPNLLNKLGSDSE